MAAKDIRNFDPRSTGYLLGRTSLTIDEHEATISSGWRAFPVFTLRLTTGPMPPGVRR
jgi:hypothetical protein